MRKMLLRMCMMAIMMVVGMSAYALDKTGGVYQIGTAADLEDFAALVNDGEVYANAVLTADIVKDIDGVMIGGVKGDYQGTFDGKGHTITINLFQDAENGMALFRNLGVHGIVQNLKVQGTITISKKFAAGIAVYGSGIIRDCYVDVNVVSAMAGDATHGGIVADAFRGTVIENCLAKFTINGATTQNCGGIVGWCENPVNIVNCLVINDGSNFDISNNGSANIARNTSKINVPDLTKYNADPYANRPSGANYNNYVTNKWGDNNATTVVAYNDLADGRICYQLNNDQSRIAWVQEIGVDPFPVPAPFGSGKQVFASGPTGCNGKSDAALTFSNSGTVQATPHEFDKYGMCPVCGCFNFHYFEFDDAEKFDKTDRAALLKSSADIDVVEGWNRIGDGFKLNMKMANDIEYIAEPGHAIVNTSNWVDGDFNGDGHELTIEVSDVGTDAACFIPQHTGIFENVIMHGSITTSGQYAGSISARARQATVRNVFSDIEINTTHVGDNTTGGLFGIAYGTKHVDNCIYAGNINGIEGTECIAGFCGWSDGTTYLTNCAFVGTLTNAEGDSKTISRRPTGVICENVYSVNDYDLGDSEKFTHYENEAGVESGELAYYLNDKVQGLDRFYQKIGEDMYPLPIKKEGALVYASAANYRCDGVPLGATTYSNTPSESVIPPHNYVDGFCSACGNMQEDFLTPVDGWFDISNGAELAWWSNYAAKHLDSSARLTDDIDMDGYSDRWADVGTRSAPFYGNFDGQFHTISNLNIYRPGTDGAGLIGIMNSQPSSGFGGLSDNDARASEGVFIKNVVLDETCSIYAHGYAAIVGMTANWAGHITFEGLMMLGDVTVDGGVNGGGILGCVMNEACRVTINNCGMVGNIHALNNSNLENGSFSGWIGKYAELTNCFAIGEVDNMDANRGFARHYVGDADHKIVIKNCYALDGIGMKQITDGDAKEDVSFVSAEELQTGAITWKANGSQFRTPYWYQTIGEDEYPFPDPAHGTVVCVGKQYMTANAETLPEVISAFSEFYSDKISSDVIAYTGAIEAMEEGIDVLEKVKDIPGLADAVDSLNVYEAVVNASVKVYQKYVAKCEEIKAYLEEHPEIEGSAYDALENYLENDYEEICETHELPDSMVEKEIIHVDEMFTLAIANYSPGSDVSKLIPNYDFSKKKESWTNGWCTGYGQVQDEKGNTVHGVEGWNVTGDMHQVVEGMKPGYYLVGVNGAFRPSNNRYSTNYAAGIYANGVFNYFPAVIEDYVAAADTVDQVNCNLHGSGAHDLAIYDDGVSTDDSGGAEVLGYAVHGETGMAIAAMTNRYQAYTIAYVGEDGKLTIGIKNPGTKYSNDWTGWGALKVIYCGDDEEKSSEALDLVLENMSARAQVILEYMPDEYNPAAAPNFPEELRGELEAAIARVEVVETVADKAELAATFSDIFQEIYEGKRAYVKLNNMAHILESLEGSNLALIEKDATGTWYGTGEGLFSSDEMDAVWNITSNLFDAYDGGTYSTEQALNPESLQDPVIAKIVPAQDEDGYFLISTPEQMATYRAICNEIDKTAKAKMTADIDMKGIAMEPIGHSANIYAGEFDGQGHSLSNVFISDEFMTIKTNSDPATLFYELQNASVKNLKLSGEYHSDQKFMGGLTRWMSGKSTVDNCEIAVAMYSAIDGDGTHGGVMGIGGSTDAIVKNTLVNCQFFSEEGVTTTCCGGVCGWANSAPQVTNVLVLNQYGVSADGSNTISRNGSTVSNVFVSQTFGESGGTLVSSEQLASGEVCWKLNGSTAEDAHWFQTLGKDETPHLFGGSLVWKNGDEYQNSRPNIQLNAFASNLSAATNAEQVVIAYTLNAEAKSAAINFYAGDELKYSHVLKGGDLLAGGHEVAIDNSLLGVAAGTKMTYALDVTALGVNTVTKIGDSYKVYSAYGLAVNNVPASKGFGQIYVAESRPLNDAKGYISEQKPGALFAFDATFNPINAEDGTPGFYGGLDIKDNKNVITISGDYQFDLKNVRISKDGRLFIARTSGNSTSSVWEADPADLNKPWTPIFTGGELDASTGIVTVGDEEQNRPAVALAVEGEGESLKLTVLGAQCSDGAYNYSDYKCFTYDLGKATSWTGVPSSVFEPLSGQYTIAPGHVGIVADNRGGLWYEQYRANPKDTEPAIKHYDATGKEDYSDVSTATYGEAIAISDDGSTLAIPMGNGKVVIYETNYVPMANGKIFLEAKYNFNVTETQITGMAFDYANNLYITSSASKTLSRYAIPSWTDNKTVTPAPEGFTVGAESGDPDAIKSVNGNTTNGAIYNIAGQRVSKAQKGIFIQDGRKVSVK